MPPAVAPFGSWRSPLTTDVITEKTISIAEVIVDAATGTLYHVEDRPHERGRRVLVHTDSGKDVFGSEWNARTGVHEYGGSAAAVYKDTALFTDWTTKRVYVCAKSSDGWEEPKPATPDNSNLRFGEFRFHPTLPHLVIAILEDHTNPAPADVVNTLVLIDIQAQNFKTIAEGADFYAFGRFSPDGQRLSWVQWWHPDMPWEGSELYAAELSITSYSISIKGSPTLIAGSRETNSITQPDWSSPTKLIFVSDKTGFYNHYVHDFNSGSTQLGLGEPIEEDFAEPAWSLDNSNYAILREDTILVPGSVSGQSGFLVVDLFGKRYSFISSPYVSTSHLRALPLDGDGAGATAVFVGTGDDRPAALIQVSLLLGKPKYSILNETTSALSTPALQDFAFSKGEPKTFEVGEGIVKKPLHVIFYGPKNKDYIGPEDEKPPCVVNVHGGPTSKVPPGLKWLTQYWTSRGWAWVDVNYGGSSGYGRAYRERLAGKWGIADVEDCVSSVYELGKAGLVDPKRVTIRGGSAGGFTVLCALVAASKVYATGTSSYGVSDLAALEQETHKFESQYLHKLMGGSMAEIPDVYKDRSPAFHAEKITAPLLILQGSVDAVVPPNQAELMEQKIKDNGGKVKYVLFDGEGHGWRRADTIKQALELELQWYGEVLGIDVQL
ncbi:Prolyl oligopeptidase family [Ceratobasidium sp. AG-Ba]|nr:Prolyl oligopeptidase family [Ceratobasidium sp. AG-Ba]